MQYNAQLGEGVYSVSDAAEILRLPTYKVRRWLKEYWNKRLMGGNIAYSWGEGRDVAFNFATLIEFYVFFQLKEAGVRTKKILIAHEKLAHRFKTPVPFASLQLLTDGGRILFYADGGDIVDVEPNFQYNFKEIIQPFCRKIEFDCDKIATRFYPLGKDTQIVVDPHHQFGQPTIENTNILPHTIWTYYKGGETPEFIASIFDLTHKQIADAIKFCKKAA